MKRRSFLKGLGSLLTLAYVAPTALIPKGANAYVTTAKKANDYYTTVSCEVETIPYHLDDFTKNIIRPAAKKLAEDIDNYIANQIIKGELHES